MTLNQPVNVYRQSTVFLLKFVWLQVKQNLAASTINFVNKLPYQLIYM